MRTKKSDPEEPTAAVAAEATTTAAESGSATSEAPPPPQTQLTPEQLLELLTRAAKADENYDHYVRTAADLENFKKRAAREKQDAIRYANEGLLTKLVSVLDNFDMALAAANNSQGEGVEGLKTGVSMIAGQIRAVLREAGLEEIDATQQKFDPNFHEAVSQQPSADVPEGHVLQQLRKGYKYRERLLRPASVIVAALPAPADNP